MPKGFQKGDEVRWADPSGRQTVFRVISGAVEGRVCVIDRLKWSEPLGVEAAWGVVWVPVDELVLVRAAPLTAEPEGPWAEYHVPTLSKDEDGEYGEIVWRVAGEERPGSERGTKWQTGEMWRGDELLIVARLWRRLWSRKMGGRKVLLHKQEGFTSYDEAKAWVDRQVMEPGITSRFARTEPL